MATAQGPGTHLRADAARNRREIIKAARELYGRRGLDAPLDEIARLAYFLWEARGGVGGSPEEDWFQAKQALAERSGTDGPILARQNGSGAA